MAKRYGGPYTPSRGPYAGVTFPSYYTYRTFRSRERGFTGYTEQRRVSRETARKPPERRPRKPRGAPKQLPPARLAWRPADSKRWADAGQIVYGTFRRRPDDTPDGPPLALPDARTALLAKLREWQKDGIRTATISAFVMTTTNSPNPSADADNIVYYVLGQRADVASAIAALEATYSDDRTILDYLDDLFGRDAAHPILAVYGLGLLPG